eukprot:3425157-Rhodomonas_salina.1
MAALGCDLDQLERPGPSAASLSAAQSHPVRGLGNAEARRDPLALALLGCLSRALAGYTQARAHAGTVAMIVNRHSWQKPGLPVPDPGRQLDRQASTVRLARCARGALRPLLQSFRIKGGTFAAHSSALLSA